MKRNAQFDAHAAFLTAKQFKSMCCAIELSQPCPGVRQADSFFDPSVLIKTRTVVTHDQRQNPILAVGLQFAGRSNSKEVKEHDGTLRSKRKPSGVSSPRALQSILKK